MYQIYAKLRDEKGMKDADVARATGLHPSVISDWRRGKSTPKSDKLRKIADALGVSVDTLITGEHYYIDPDTAQIAQEIYENKELRILFDASRKATPEQLKLLQQMALSWHANDNDVQ